MYKLVEINGKPKIKLSQDVEKVTMPGKKNVFRLFSSDGNALIDILQKPEEAPPQVGKRVLCRHPFQVRIAKQSVLINEYDQFFNSGIQTRLGDSVQSGVDVPLLLG